MNQEFVPEFLSLKIIALLDKCKCKDCQNEKEKREEKLLQNHSSQQKDISNFK
jgi:hypothetical protein